jgi:hypothetical protein
VLIAAIVVLTVAFGLGLWLGCLYMLVERPPGRLTWIGGLHGAAGTAGVGVLLLALHGPPQGVRLGAGPFGKIAGALLVAALAGGLTVLTTHMRKRPVSVGLVALHGTFAIMGYTLLCTYFSMVP